MVFWPVEAAYGGSNRLSSGIDRQIQASIASDAARTLSNQQLGITQANYAQRRENFNNAVGGTRLLAGLYRPDLYAHAGTIGNSNAFDEAKTIQQQEAAKTITGLGMSALSGISGGLGNLDSTGSSTPWEQVKNFGSGFSNALG